MGLNARKGISDLQDAIDLQKNHGDISFKVRKRPMYVIRGAWNDQAPNTNSNILGFALEKLPYIPSILITDEYGIFFGTPGQCNTISELYDDDIVGYWGKKEGMIPIYKKDIVYTVSVPTKKTNPYPKKYILDKEHIIEKINYV